jgi:hypothetical protein
MLLPENETHGVSKHVVRDFVHLLYMYRYPYFDVVVGLVWSHDPKRYAGGSVCYW